MAKPTNGTTTEITNPTEELEPETETGATETETTETTEDGISPEIANLVTEEEADEARKIQADKVLEAEQAALAQKKLDDDLLAETTRKAQADADARAAKAKEMTEKAEKLKADRIARNATLAAKAEAEKAGDSTTEKAKSEEMIRLEEEKAEADKKAKELEDARIALAQKEFESETEAEWIEYEADRKPWADKEAVVMARMAEDQIELDAIREELAVIDSTNPRASVNLAALLATTASGNEAVEGGLPTTKVAIAALAPTPSGLVRVIGGKVEPMTKTNGRFYTDFRADVTTVQAALIKAQAASGLWVVGNEVFCRAMGRDEHARIAANQGIKPILTTTYEAKANKWIETAVWEVTR